MSEPQNTPFALATIVLAGRPTPIIRIGGRHFTLEQVLPEAFARTPARGLLNVFDNWPANEELLVARAQGIAAHDTHAGLVTAKLTPDDFLAPLLYPKQVVCMGANYYEHVRGDVGMTQFDRATAVPTVFIKTASKSLVGAGRSVRYPSESQKFDWEIELAMVIGKRGKRVNAHDALSLIAGFTVAIDLSARDWQHHPRHPFKFDCFAGKAFDDSCPVGPWIVPARFVDHRNLGLRLWVNGDLKQNGNTKDMIWSIGEQLEAMSSHVTLEPGDIVLTGTPAGVGLKTNTFLKVGDRIAAEIDGLGRLEVEIAPDQDLPLKAFAHA